MTGGRYTKLSRHISQTPWLVEDDVQRVLTSVETVIGTPVQQLVNAGITKEEGGADERDEFKLSYFWRIFSKRFRKCTLYNIWNYIIFSKPCFVSEEVKLHASGREDIDVRMLGTGRPFYLQIVNGRRVPTQAQLDQIQAGINESDQKVHQLKFLKQSPVFKLF